MAVKDTLRNFETFTASLSGNGEKITSIIATAEDSINAVDGALTKTKDFLAGLGSDKYGGELLPTVISLRELIESFDKKSGAVDRRHPQDARRGQRSPSTRRPEIWRGPPPRALSCLSHQQQDNGNARRARQIPLAPDRPARHRDPRRERRAARLAKISLARRFRADRAAPDSEIPLWLYLRRRRDRRGACATTAKPSTNTVLCRACSTTSPAATRPRRCSARPMPRRSAFRRWALRRCAPIAATSC